MWTENKNSIEIVRLVEAHVAVYHIGIIFPKRKHCKCSIFLYKVLCNRLTSILTEKWGLYGIYRFMFIMRQLYFLLQPKEDNPSWFWDYAVGYYSLEFMLWLRCVSLCFQIHYWSLTKNHNKLTIAVELTTNCGSRGFNKSWLLAFYRHL